MLDSGARWHALAIGDVLERLRTTPDGLAEIEGLARARRYGRNALEVVRPASAWVILFRQLRSTVSLLLVAAAALALLTGDVTDAVAIGAVLFINVGIGLGTELRATRAMEALLALEVPRAIAFRQGRPREIDARDLVPGDVIALAPGQAVPADARLIRAVELRTMEAALTGESLPTSKRADIVLPADTPLPDRANLLYLGTSVITGSALAVVVATGMATEVGRIGTLVGGIAEEPTPLERRLDALGRRLAAVALGVAALVAMLGLLQRESVAVVTRTGVAVAVAAVPEGLPAVVTIAMAVGVWRMARRRALVRRLPAVESLGSTTVICTDKTGTLTTGEMTLTTLWLDGREVRVTGIGYAPVGRFFEGTTAVDPMVDGAIANALRIGALANRADLVRVAERWEARGDPTEAALLAAALKAGISRDELLSQWPEEGELPFSSERMLMATYHRAPDGRLTAFAKGAPGRIIARSDRVRTSAGEHVLDDRARERLGEQNEMLAARGLRVLGLAHAPVAGMEECELRGLTFAGFAGMFDPPAPGVPETIRQLRQAGIRSVMLTGDQRRTAQVIARELGVLAAGEETLDGQLVDAMTDEELADRVGRVGAFSRVSPDAKLRIVTAFQRQGEVVAMVGDGVNDAAALKKADIGVAMGRRGTDVAKEAAAIVLEDDRFQTVGAAVEEGRVIFDDIGKFVFYLFSCNLAEILVLLGAGAAGLPLPLLPLQILWLNLLTDTFPALALAFEPADADVMRRRPRDPRAALLSGRELRTIVVYALLISGCTLAGFAWGLRGGAGDAGRAVTLSFMTLSLAQILHLGNARSQHPVIAPTRATANPYALGAVLLALALQLSAVYHAPLARVLGVVPPSATDWPVVIGLGLLPAVTGQVVKGLRLLRRQHPSAATE